MTRQRYAFESLGKAIGDVVSAAVSGFLPGERAEGSFERSLEVPVPLDLRLGAGSGSVSIRAEQASTARVVGRITARARTAEEAADLLREVEADPPIRFSGSELAVGTEVWSWPYVSISYEITVPEETSVDSHTGSGRQDVRGVRGPLDISTGSGRVDIEDAGSDVRAETGSGGIRVKRAHGDVRLMAGSGRVQARDIGGSVHAETGSGSVEILQPGGDVRADTGSGRVTIEGADSEVSASTSSGSINVVGAPRSSAWSLRTGSGSIHVELAEGTAFEIDAETGSGGIHVAHPLSDSTRDRHSLRGIHVRSDTRISARTASGSISVS